MPDTYGIQKLLGKKGIAGPIFLVNPSNNAPMVDDDSQILYLARKNGTQITGFYSVKVEIDDVYFTATITINGWKSKADFLRNRPFLINIVYRVTDAGEVLNTDGSIATPGAYSTYFAKDIVKAAGDCEQWKAIDLVLSLTGTQPFQTSFPVSFSALEGFSTSQITQANINAVNSV